MISNQIGVGLTTCQSPLSSSTTCQELVDVDVDEGVEEEGMIVSAKAESGIVN